MSKRDFQDIKVNDPYPGVLQIELNRPEARNALRNQTLEEISNALVCAEKEEVRCVVINGSEKCFAAGADIKELQKLNPSSSATNPRIKYWKAIRDYPLPLIAAVNGYALGGGCELAMHCDIIIAGKNASFGQPEIRLGIIPGAGGTQRLIRAVGKSQAMEMILTGQFIDADRALSCNLVSKVVNTEQTVAEALDLAQKISKMPPIAIKLAKKSLLSAYELSLSEALEFERQHFAHLTGTKDMQIGIKSFLNKHSANFVGE